MPLKKSVRPPEKPFFNSIGQERRFERASATSGLPRKPTFACAALSDATGHERHFALHKSSQPFRRQPIVKSVTDLPIGA